MRMKIVLLLVITAMAMGAAQTLSLVDGPGGFVWGGQRFLAARLYIDNKTGAITDELKSIRIKNVLTDKPLAGTFVAVIEVVRPTDGRVLGRESRSDYLRPFTDVGVVINLSPSHKTPPYTESFLEIWVALKSSTEDAPLPPGHGVALGVEGARLPDIRTPARVGDPAPGLNDVQEVRLAGAAVFSGQTFLALKLRLVDADQDHYPVRLRFLQLRNTAEAPLSELYIKSIEVRRSRDQKVLGRTTSVAGLNTSGISVTLGGTGITERDLEIPDDDELEVEIYVTLDTKIPTDRKLRLEALVFHSEGGFLYPYPPERARWATGPTFSTRAAGGLMGTDITGRGSWIFAGTTALVQEIKLEPRFPGDPNDSLLTRIVIKNVSTASPVGDGHVSKIEVRTGDGSLVAQTTKITGLLTTGVTLSCNYLVKAGTSLILEIYVSLRADTPAGRKIRLETEVKHTSGGLDLTTGSIRSEVEFTTAVNYPHIVDFTYTPPNPRWDQAVSFTPNVRDDERDPVGRDAIVYSRWEFGDGKVMEHNGPPETVRHTYNKGGKFTVTLLVRDDKGLEAKKSKEITLANSAPQGVDFDWDPKVPKWSDRIAFTPSRNILDPDGDIRQATFRWSFGDGKTLETRGSETIHHTYGKGGDFTVTLTVIDAGGAEASKSYKITVSNLPPTGVDFTISPEDAKWNEPVTFTPVRGITDPDGDLSKATFKWEFGDGESAQTTGPQEMRHTYTKSGEYEVTLTVTDQGGASAKKTKKITVSWPKVNFTWRPEQPKAGEEVTFTASPEPDTFGFGYRWDFGDGTIWPPAAQPPATTHIATHTFTFPETLPEKTFTVKLTVTLGATVVGTAEKSVKVIRVVNRPPTITSLKMDPAMPKPREEITFTATASDPDGDAIMEWQWDLGDGTTRSTVAGTIKHKYDKAGAYTVKVRAKDTGSGSFGEWRSLSFYVGTQPIGVNVLDNPASTTCQIQVFTPAGATKVKITILDAAGRPILPEKDVTGGMFTWDLKDREGRVVPNGLYLFFVTAELQGQVIRSEIGRILVRR